MSKDIEIDLPSTPLLSVSAEWRDIAEKVESSGIFKALKFSFPQGYLEELNKTQAALNRSLDQKQMNLLAQSAKEAQELQETYLEVKEALDKGLSLFETLDWDELDDLDDDDVVPLSPETEQTVNNLYLVFVEASNENKPVTKSKLFGLLTAISIIFSCINGAPIAASNLQSFSNWIFSGLQNLNGETTDQSIDSLQDFNSDSLVVDSQTIEDTSDQDQDDN